MNTILNYSVYLTLLLYLYMSTNYFYINKMNQNYYLRFFEQVRNPNL